MLRIFGRSMRSPQLFGKSTDIVRVSCARYLNLLEYQSKELLRDSGVSVQNFAIVDDLAKTNSALDKLHADEFVIKAQVLAGGRGKGWFDNGFKGGVHLTKDRKAVANYVKNMLGHRLITKQTSKDGILVQKIMIAESVDIARETYVCILMDRQHNGPVLIASPAGGMDIETVAEKHPEKIKTVPLDIYHGIDDAIAKDVCNFLGFVDADLLNKAMYELKNLWKLFVDIDALQVEINPLVETTDKQVVAVDAKIAFDDNAEFRQRDLFALEDTSEKDPREVDASRFNLNYIGMDGNIGCLVNGAGLAMATMDIIKLNGGLPANFLDVGGNVKEDQVFQAFRILSEDPKVKVILVNVFGGIVNCVTIARGIIAASKNLGLKIPLVVRLEGTNVTEAKKVLAESELPILTANNLDEAAKKAVISLQDLIKIQKKNVCGIYSNSTKCQADRLAVRLVRFVFLIYEFKPDPSFSRLRFTREKRVGGGTGDELLLFPLFPFDVCVCVYIDQPLAPRSGSWAEGRVLFSDNFTDPSNFFRRVFDSRFADGVNASNRQRTAPCRSGEPRRSDPERSSHRVHVREYAVFDSDSCFDRDLLLNEADIRSRKARNIETSERILVSTWLNFLLRLS